MVCLPVVPLLYLRKRHATPESSGQKCHKGCNIKRLGVIRIPYTERAANEAAHFRVIPIQQVTTCDPLARLGERL